MSDEYDFPIEPKRDFLLENDTVEAVPVPAGRESSPDENRIVITVIENFPRILDLVEKYVDMQIAVKKGQVEIAKLEAYTAALERETDVYIKKLREETDSVIKKAEIVRKLLNDYYETTSNKITGEQFVEIISKVIEDLLKKEDGSWR